MTSEKQLESIQSVLNTIQSIFSNNIIHLMSDSNKELKNLVEKTEKLTSGVDKSAIAVEKLEQNIIELTKVIEKADESSTKLSQSLNRMTGVAVIIAIVTLGFEIYDRFNP